MESGSTIKDLAKSVHTDLSEGLLYGFDIRSRRRLGVDYVLKNNDVVKIVATTRKG
jgi:ribosome-interacting GTPase 1